MKVLAAAIFFITSVTAESAHLWVFLGEAAAMDVAMNASLLEKESSGIEFAVDDVGHDYHDHGELVRDHTDVSVQANTNNNEGPADKTGAGEKEDVVSMKDVLAELKAVAKNQADTMDAVDAIAKNQADMNDRLEELEGTSKKSWTNTIWEHLTPGNLLILHRAFKLYVTPAASTKVVCNTVVNQFVDSSTAEPICDSLSYAVDLVDVDAVKKVKDEVINLID